MANAETGTAATGYRAREVTVRGTRIHLLAGGAGDPLLYLHGAGDPGLWTPALAALAGHFSVFRPDHPGFGASGELADLDSVHELAFFCLDLLDELGLDRVVLAGHSLGGWLAADLATIEPARVSKLVLVAPAGLRPQQPVPDVFRLSPTELAELLYHTASARSAAAAEAAQLAEDTDAFARYLRNRAATAHLGWNPYLHDPKLARRLHRITAPALILWGAGDRLLPASGASQWAALLPAAQVRIIEEAGHLPLTEQPAATVAAILSFCAEG